jgi:hypothetical protein
MQAYMSVLCVSECVINVMNAGLHVCVCVCVCVCNKGNKCRYLCVRLCACVHVHQG